jgi:hypothetical protein
MVQSVCACGSRAAVCEPQLAGRHTASALAAGDLELECRQVMDTRPAVYAVALALAHTAVTA